MFAGLAFPLTTPETASSSLFNYTKGNNGKALFELLRWPSKHLCPLAEFSAVFEV
jgi:hypothetical protein